MNKNNQWIASSQIIYIVKGLVVVDKEKKVMPDEEKAVDVTGVTSAEKNSSLEEAAEKFIPEESEEMKALQDELIRQKDLLLRTAAEYDNFRKRTKREKEQFFAQAKCDVLSPLLPVFDSLERAVETESSTLEDYKKGVELVGAQLGECLKLLGVEKIGQSGEPFDPEKHNAVSHEEKSDAEENTLAQVLQKGYSVDGKILRHAVVSVYK